MVFPDRGTTIIQQLFKSNSSSSSAHHSPLLDTGLSNRSPSRSIFNYPHPAPPSRPAPIITPRLLSRGLHSRLLTSMVFGSTADMASPLPLQHANTLCYVGNFSPLPDHLVSNSIPQRNSENSFFHSLLSNLELVDQCICIDKIKELHYYFPSYWYRKNRYCWRD
jgi:hypothetical protein